MTVVQPAVISGQPGEGAVKLLSKRMKSRLSQVVQNRSDITGVQKWPSVRWVNRRIVGLASKVTRRAMPTKSESSNEVQVISDEALVEVHEPLTIVSELTDARVVKGAGATFKIEVTGTAPISYEWRFNGNIIEGAVVGELFVPDASSADEGVYQVVLNNPLVKW